eukprot:m.687136 g.687136  ORF g.687136 m.687136 type:complete len:54 (-) comp22840_c0_seq59:2532-2693(-)
MMKSANVRFTREPGDEEFCILNKDVALMRSNQSLTTQKITARCSCTRQFPVLN